MGSIGKKGEEVAATFLQNKGFAIVDRNYKCRFGEVDIIAEDDTFIVFAEVKTRKAPFTDSGLYAVDARKQARLRKTAQVYLSEGALEKQPRFDVIIVAHERGFCTVVQHIENAF